VIDRPSELGPINVNGPDASSAICYGRHPSPSIGPGIPFLPLSEGEAILTKVRLTIEMA
jgi:hypothetical protein